MSFKSAPSPKVISLRSRRLLKLLDDVQRQREAPNSKLQAKQRRLLAVLLARRRPL
jgi:hypothetical protein